MINEMNTAVITSCDRNMQENLEFDFLTTLRGRAGYKGKIVLLDYGISEDIRERIEKNFDVQVVACEKKIGVCGQRYCHLPSVINSLEPEITSLLLIDGGDIWFQNSIFPIFEATENKIGCVEERPIMGEDEWTQLGLDNLTAETQEEILKYSRGYHVKNSGMIAGPREMLVSMAEAIYNDICKMGIHFFGLDQILFNYEFMKLSEEKRTTLDMDYNFVLVTNKELFYVKEEDVYCKSNDQLITVVHNAGAAWRVLERKFKNKYSDFEQYRIENIEILEND